MVTVLQDPRFQGLQQAGTALAQALQQYQQGSLQAAQQGALSSVLQGMSQPQEGGVQTLLQQQLGMLGDLAAAGVSPNEFGSILPLLQPKQAPKSQTEFDKLMDRRRADIIGAHLDEASSGSSFQDNLDYLIENAKTVGKGKYWLTGEPFYASEEFAEYRTRGLLVLDKVIKIFNPAGVLAKSKLDWINTNFSIDPSMTQNQINGRLAAIQSLGNVASKYNTRIGELIETYGVNIPIEELVAAKRDAENEVSAIEKRVGGFQGKVKEKNLSNLNEDAREVTGDVVDQLPKEAKQGQLMRDTKTDKLYVYRDGRWKLKKE